MQIISKKSRYALHGLAYIAKFSNGLPVPFEEILEYLEDYGSGLTLSPGYIAKVFQSISRAGITEATSGPSGGYRLAREPAEIRLIEVIEALDGPLLAENCCLLSVDDECRQQPSCGVIRLIRDCEMIFLRFLEKQSVASLAQRMIFPDQAVFQDQKPSRPARASRVAARVRG